MFIVAGRLDPSPGVKTAKNKTKNPIEHYKGVNYFSGSHMGDFP